MTTIPIYNCGLYYNRITIVATIVIQISQIILIAKKFYILEIFPNFERNNLAYLDYDRSYDRNEAIVLATAR